MSNVKSIADRNRAFEEAHCSCKELMEAQIQKIENYASKWLLIGIGALFLLQAAGFAYSYFEFASIKRKIHHRYFLLEESLEEIHKVNLEKGKVVRDYTKQ